MPHGPRQPAPLSLDQKLSVLRHCPGLDRLSDAQLAPLAERMRPERIAQWMMKDEPLATRPLRLLYRGIVLLTQTDRLEALTRPVGAVALLGTEGVEHWWCENDPRPEQSRIPKFAFRAAAVVECLTLDRTDETDPFDALLDPTDPACTPLREALHTAYHVQVAAPDIVAALRTTSELASARQSFLYSLALGARPLVLHAGETIPRPGLAPGDDVVPVLRRSFTVLLSGQVKVADGDSVEQVFVRRGCFGFAEALVGAPPPAVEAIRDSQLVTIPWTRLLARARRDPRVQRLAAALGAVDATDFPESVRWRFSGQDRVLLLDAPGGEPTSSWLALLVARQLARDVNRDVVLIDVVPADGQSGDGLGDCELPPHDGVGGTVTVRSTAVGVHGAQWPSDCDPLNPGVVIVNALALRDERERSRMLAFADYTTIAWFFEEGDQWEDLPFELASQPCRLLPVILLPSPRKPFPLLEGLVGRVTKTIMEGEDAAYGMRPPLDAVRIRLPRELLSAPPTGPSTPHAPTRDGLDDHDRANVGRLGRALTSRRVGLALGGGGALGYVHATLIAALRENNVPIDIITGTSFGAVVGAYWSVLAEAGGKEAEAAALRQLLDDWAYPMAALSVGTISTVGVELWIDARLGRHRLDQLETTYVPVATSAWDGTQVPAIRGTVGDGVRASGSFPPFGPTIVGEERLLDGGIAANVPVYMAELSGADIVVASNAVAPPQSLRPTTRLRLPYISEQLQQFNIYQRLVDVVRANLILLRNANQSQGLSADVVYDSEVHGYTPMGFNRAREIADAAANAPGFTEAIEQAVVAFRLLEQASTPRVVLQADGHFHPLHLRWQLLFEDRGEVPVIAPSSDAVLREVAKATRSDPAKRTLHLHVIAPDVTREAPGSSASQRAEAIRCCLEKHKVPKRRLKVTSEGGSTSEVHRIEIVLQLR